MHYEFLIVLTLYRWYASSYYCPFIPSLTLWTTRTSIGLRRLSTNTKGSPTIPNHVDDSRNHLDSQLKTDSWIRISTFCRLFLDIMNHVVHKPLFSKHESSKIPRGEYPYTVRAWAKYLCLITILVDTKLLNNWIDDTTYRTTWRDHKCWSWRG